MKRFSIGMLTALLLFAALGLKAQSNNLKIEFPPLFTYQLRLNYEYKLSDNKSLMVIGGMKFPHKFPIVEKSTIALQEEFGNSVVAKNKFDGYTFGFQARFYTGYNEFPKGFYFAPYIKYHKSNLALNALYEDKINVAQYIALEAVDKQHASLLQDGNYKYKVNSEIESLLDRYSFGLAIGYQWIIGNGFTIDWTIIGISADRINASASVSAQNSYYNPDYQQWSKDIKNKINDFMDENAEFLKFITNKIETEVESNKVKFKLSTVLPMPYTAFSIGFAF